MSLEEKTHTDDGAPLGRYAQEVFSICPNCGSVMLIRGSFTHSAFWGFTSAQAQCLQCSFRRDWSSVNESWSGPVIGWARQPCPNCGNQWLTAEVYKKQINSKASQTARVQCTVCQVTSELKLNWWKAQHTGEPFDPYFGFPLWLQIDCVSHVLWAYNKEHLKVLKSYVTATHRARGYGGKWSMLNRLPQWVKSAKNRDTVLKAIGRLEEKFGELKG